MKHGLEHISETTFTTLGLAALRVVTQTNETRVLRAQGDPETWLRTKRRVGCGAALRDDALARETVGSGPSGNRAAPALVQCVVDLRGYGLEALRLVNKKPSIRNARETAPGRRG